MLARRFGAQREHINLEAKYKVIDEQERGSMEVQIGNHMRTTAHPTPSPIAVGSTVIFVEPLLNALIPEISNSVTNSIGA